MEYLYFSLIYLFIVICFIIIGHYKDLYFKKENFSRDEIFSIFHIFHKRIRSLFSHLRLINSIFIFIVATIIGIWMPSWGSFFGFNNDNWFFNSSLPFLIFYFIIPNIFFLDADDNPSSADTNKGKKNKAPLKDRAVVSVQSYFYKNFSLIMIWFGLAYIAYLIYNWGIYRSHSFFWNIGNSMVIGWFCFESSNQILSQHNQEPKPKAGNGKPAGENKEKNPADSKKKGK